ncbi:Gldg family protein [Olivibacter sitiensis]|uniref:Gldg family protein n=1 Tax=Olivibacter sitiensis TaxID=376470 RepID=UPI0003F92060|nr:Gldg family protein [Olivibacter sitiensis]
MSKIIRIAWLELKVLFYSPIAWLILAMVFLQCGLVYCDLLYSQETQQQLGRPLRTLSKVLFAGENGVLSSLQEYAYLYIPLLTMGLISRELASGSIRLLQSSPVTAWQVVLGKYLSMFVYASLIAIMMLIFVLFAYFSVSALDLHFVLFGILGIFLLICAYAAIGLFISHLTPYQIVAAIGTLALLALLSYVGHIGQSYDLLRDITYWMAISGRSEQMVNGLVSSRDLIYFLLVIGLFLLLTVMSLGHARSNLPWWKKTVRYMGIGALVVAAGYVSSLPRFTYHYDSTRFKDRTLTAGGQAIAGRVVDSIRLTTYTNVIDYRAQYGAPKNRMADIKHFEQYGRFLPGFKMDYIAYYDTVPGYRDTTKSLLEQAQTAADAMGFDFEKLRSPQQIAASMDLLPEENHLVRYFHYQGRHTPLRMFDDLSQYPSEAEISAALKRMLDGASKVAILTGHGERNPQLYGEGDYRAIMDGKHTRGSIINQGFDVQKLQLDSVEHIPSDLTVLIVADPTEPYPKREIALVQNYLQRGGNLLLLGEPARAKYLNPIAALLGLAFQEGTLLQESANFEPDLLQLHFPERTAQLGFKYPLGATVVAKGATGIKKVAEKGYATVPFFVTDTANTWTKNGPFDLNRESVSFDNLLDKREQSAVAWMLTKQVAGKEQKVFVMGDADFMGNAEMSRFNINTVNASFALHLFKWFSDGKFPVDTSRPISIDNEVTVSRAAINKQKIILLGLFPLALLVSGTLLLRYRRNK